MAQKLMDHFSKMPCPFSIQRRLEVHDRNDYIADVNGLRNDCKASPFIFKSLPIYTIDLKGRASVIFKSLRQQRLYRVRNKAFVFLFHIDLFTMKFNGNQLFKIDSRQIFVSRK